MRTALVFANPALGIVVVVGAGGELHQAVLVREGKRLKQDGVDDAEDGGIGADAEGQGKNGHRREAAAVVQLA